MEKLIYPMKNVNESQGPFGAYSHKGAPCWDDCGSNTGAEHAFAPFSMKYVGRDSVSRANACIFHSIEKILCADGVKRLLTLVCLHQDDVSNFFVGQVFKSGQAFYKEGRAGKATGNHIHFELAEGHQIVRKENVYGTRIIQNALDPRNNFYRLEGFNNVIKSSFNLKVSNKRNDEEKTVMKVKVIKSAYSDGSGYAVRPAPYAKELSYKVSIGQIVDVVDIKSYANKANTVDYGYLFLKDGNYMQYDKEYIQIIDDEKSENNFSFGKAVELLKQGKKLRRTGWNGKGMFVVYQKGYQDGIPCNRQTAEAWGIKEGDLFKCNPYLQIKNVNDSHSMWVPSINDCLADDWEVLN